MNCIPPPVAYEIQTTSFCNGRCIICPHTDVIKTPEHMRQDVFEKIIDEIDQLSPYGAGVRVIPYLNGEPFLDPKICERLDLIRKKLPDCILELSTNLSMLSENILDAIVHNRVDDLRVSCFGWEDSYGWSMPGLRFSHFQEQLSRLLDRMKTENMLETVSLTVVTHPLLRDSDIEMLRTLTEKAGINLNIWGALDRAGNVSTFKNNVIISEEDERIKRYTCAQHRHIERMHILANGDVIMCCQDWQSEAVMGNVVQSTLREIWTNPAYEALRVSIDEPSKAYPPLCKKCKILLEGAKW